MAMRDAKRGRVRTDSASADGGPGEAAVFISDAVADLALLARRHGHQTLGFLLDMAQLEADEIVRLRQKPDDF